MWRIGYHSGGSADSNAGWLDAFRKGMNDLGWLEVRDYVIDARYADGNAAAIQRLAAELVATRPDIILTTAESSILALARLTKDIPIVFTLAADPIGNGYAVSLQRPGGNLTGLTTLTPDLAGKRLQLLREAHAPTSRVLALFEPQDPASISQVRELQAAAKQLNMRLSLFEVREVTDIHAAFGRGATAADAYVVVSGPMMNIQRRLIADHLVRLKAPSISSNVIFAEAGILMTYSPSVTPNFRRAAVYIDKILKGAKAGELAIELPTRVNLVINAKTAKAIGIDLPHSLRLQADRIVE